MDDLTAIVARACAEIMAVSPATVAQRTKSDQSPVTAADEASEAAILQGVNRLLPAVPVVSEESADGNQNRFDGSFLIVDPLDGTREFLAGRDEFTVNLAIVTRGIPIAGIIAAPKRGQVWRGIVGVKAERLRLLEGGADQPQTIRTRQWPRQGAIAAVSRSHFDDATNAFLISLGSPTLKRQRLGDQVLSGRGRRRRRLSAPRNDLRVGRGGRECTCCRGRRGGDEPARSALGLRPCS